MGANAATCAVDRAGRSRSCVIRGCVPKKLLVYGSHVAEELEDAAGLGWDVGTRKHEWARLIQNKARAALRSGGGPLCKPQQQLCHVPLPTTNLHRS